MKKFAIALLAALSLSAPALAFDGVSYRVEAHSGWDRIQVSGGHKSGVIYGGAAGADLALGAKAFIGLEGDVDGSSVKECASNVLTIGDRLCARAGRDLSVIGRVGAKLDGGYKIYVLGGYTNGRVVERYTSGATSVSVGSNLDGARFGAGIEIPLRGKAYAKAEYRYSNYEQGVSRNQVLAGLGLTF